MGVLAVVTPGTSLKGQILDQISKGKVGVLGKLPSSAFFSLEFPFALLDQTQNGIISFGTLKLTWKHKSHISFSRLGHLEHSLGRGWGKC